MIASKLFAMARKMETDLAKLYKEMAGQFDQQSEVAGFLNMLSSQELTHATWVDEMAALGDPLTEIPDLKAEHFERILSTVEDLRLEVSTDEIAESDVVEIVLHLENSTAEHFYESLTGRIPGLPDSAIERMIQSCRDHATATEEFAGSLQSK
jgi:rubrerythrin